MSRKEIWYQIFVSLGILIIIDAFIGISLSSHFGGGLLTLLVAKTTGDAGLTGLTFALMPFGWLPFFIVAAALKRLIERENKKEVK